MYVSDECSYDELVRAIDAERDDKLADLYNDLSNAHAAVLNGCDQCVSAVMQAGLLNPVLTHERGCPRDAQIRSHERAIENIEDGF
jgi:alkylhydroperoxidase family enzyme